MAIARIKKRGLNSEDARKVRQQGHDDALEFALAIGLTRDYQNDVKAKKDVIDPSGDAHSVKSGQKKWQIFLYGLGRFETDEAFAVMNGMGQLLINCIKVFPDTFEKYQRKKQPAKEKLRIQMRALAEKLRTPIRLKAFMNKAMFNGGEVDYLTVKHEGKFHVFYYKDVIEKMSEKLEVLNSSARSKGQTPEQKVILRYKGKNLGEVEMRNDSPVHYREIRFNMVKPRVMEFLFKEIPFDKNFNEKVLMYGSTSKRFGRW
ncbi:hypothetical protein HZB93_04455 [Candidatus Falkowbacteria bacterium]|nr:hypothetical protein [Candidatus Falkowbacteria bacterium]